MQKKKQLPDVRYHQKTAISPACLGRDISVLAVVVVSHS